MVIVATNPYLESNFAPVELEITADHLPVIGEIPPDLNGMFLRNGPNPLFPSPAWYHWFDGHGMLHGVQINNGKAKYHNRYIQTEGWKSEKDAGRAVWSGFLTPPQAENAPTPPVNTANTAVVWHANRLLALWEGGEPYHIQLPELTTVGPYTYEGKLQSAFTAHPKIDFVTGEMMFFGYSWVNLPHLQYSVVSPQGQLLRTVPIDLPVGVMMHDFAITANYTIFMNLPLTFRLERAQQGKPPLLFEQDIPSRFGILPRHGDNSSIRWFEAPACYVAHTLNAYEDGDEVVLMACRMQTTTMLGLAGRPQYNQTDIPFLYKWRFNLKTGAVIEEPLDDIPSEFPRVNDQQLGYKTRYGYTCRMASHLVPLFNGLIKYDFDHGSSQTHEFGQERYGSEAVFVPRPGATDEDEGWLLTFVFDELTKTSELIVLDAQDIIAEPVARILIPQRVPYGFHGTWIDQKNLNQGAYKLV
ncbi:carotenoid oxygenase family protein [Nostoc sp. CENA67]|uniref:Carotenoid oxygenase family protein n=1 Tax=Amazonocrinis nigriterrae CENA67 TaxID=2794033 RepID=A0A8J7LA25_9NOST|nr:carotenoid oxygenase family protein [Amazonocrinis nigriterrae]MBH8562131.1 carotenoid oxygenase family protein [Amazonocrinis nigriterrae CENA67]